jgi:hypothetical protein
MHRHLGKIGSIRRELKGKACPFCGGYKYHLILRATTDSENHRLLARCNQCQRPKDLDDDMGRFLWM